MPTSLIVVDDFLGARDAHGLREAGLQLTYPEQQGPFPGRNSLERLEIEGLDQAVSQIVGERVKPISPLQSHASECPTVWRICWRILIPARPKAVCSTIAAP